MAGRYGFHHLICRTGPFTVSYPQSGIIYQRKYHVTFIYRCHFSHHIYIMSRHSYRSDEALCLSLVEIFPCSGPLCKLAAPHFVKKKYIYDIYIQSISRLFHSVLHGFIIGAQTFGTDDRP